MLKSRDGEMNHSEPMIATMAAVKRCYDKCDATGQKIIEQVIPSCINFDMRYLINVPGCQQVIFDRPVSSAQFHNNTMRMEKLWANYTWTDNESESAKVQFRGNVETDLWKAIQELAEIAPKQAEPKSHEMHEITSTAGKIVAGTVLICSSIVFVSIFIGATVLAVAASPITVPIRYGWRKLTKKSNDVLLHELRELIFLAKNK